MEAEAAIDRFRRVVALRALGGIGPIIDNYLSGAR